MSLDPFAKSPMDPFKSGDAFNPKAPDDIFTKPKPKFGGGGSGNGGGGTGRARRPEPEPELEPLDIPIEPVAPEPEKPKPSVTLRNPKWEVEKVGFNEETDISVEVDLPEKIAHRTKIAFELFAKTPDGPCLIVKGEGHAKDGKASCRIPVYIPSYKDANGNSLQKVDYYFTAKHSDSVLLNGSAKTKLVDEMSERLIESHILPDLTFAFDKSFLHPKHAAALKSMCATIKTWREKNPDGKLAVFGHADAVGKEEYNKALSERRAKSVFGFLMKDTGAWSELDKEEKWDLVCIQDLLRHLGHDPGASDGQDGPKTQGAVKEFQKKQGLFEDGKAGSDTRKAIYQSFMDDCNSLSLKAKNFDDINGSPIAGCSEFNLVEETKGACEANRRVAVLLLKSNKNFPIHYPCAKGDVNACKSQVGREGKRRTAGFGCFFYDGLVVEKKGGGGKSTEPISNLHWDVETAQCGDSVKLLGDSTLPAGTEVKVKLATESEVCEETKCTITSGKFELIWVVHSVHFSIGEDGKPLPEAEIFTDLEISGKKYDPTKNLKVKKVHAGKPEIFDQKFQWGKYGVHSKFTQAIEGKTQKITVKKKVMKTWGATYVDLTKAGVKGVGGDFPWAGMRWARCKKNTMAPVEYWDNKEWKLIPTSAGIDSGDYGTLPIIKTGNKAHWVKSKDAIWPDPVEDYKWEDYENKRNAWINDSSKRWSEVFNIRRKDCKAPPEKFCCSYEFSLEFTMEKVDAYGEDVICLSPGPLRSNAGLLFYGDDRIAMGAHEVGHLVGQPDEYPKGAVDTSVNGDGAVNGLDNTTLMGSSLVNESNNKIKKRHYSNFVSMARKLIKNSGGKDEDWVLVEAKVASK